MVKLRRFLGRLKESKQTFLLGLNYHRIGSVDRNNPFHQLHTVHPFIFKLQIRIVGRFAGFVSLGDILEGNLPNRFNAFITFDDTSSSVRRITPWLRTKGIPYAICPCVEITEQGFGVRDQVYWIIAKLSPERIRRQVAQALGEEEALRLDASSFYRYSKGHHPHPDVMRQQVITPLFQELLEAHPDIGSEGAYLSWDAIEREYRYDSLATLANHSLGHGNMGLFSQEQVREDVALSHHVFQKRLDGFTPSIFAVPFGTYGNPLAYDLSLVARELKYRLVLWVSDVAHVVDDTVTHHHIRHLGRLHVSPSLGVFIRQLIQAFLGARQGMAVTDGSQEEGAGGSHRMAVVSASDLREQGASLQDQDGTGASAQDRGGAGEGTERDPVQASAFALEDLLRPEKDYAASADYFRHAFTDNPWREGRPETFFAWVDGRPQGIGYNFFMPMILGGQGLVGNYWSGWRKLPACPGLLSAALLRKGLKLTDITGSYYPSTEMDATVQGKRWFGVEITRLTFSPGGEGSDKPVVGSVDESVDGAQRLKGDMEVTDTFPAGVEGLLGALNARLSFSIHRSPRLYRWRLESYPLAKPLYFVWRQGSKALCLLVCQTRGERLLVADVVAGNSRDLEIGLSHFFAWCRENGVEQVVAEGSNAALIEHLDRYAPHTREVFKSYYYFGKGLGAEGLALMAAAFADPKRHLFETPLCGDLLLR
ncbi:MAG: polysaccharide deacetylase family protein [Magnetococcales bacterium]|nr:polysaccharide deacetylase family protein [Magnetococcales bacterium]